MKSPVDITSLKIREVSYAQELQLEIFRGSNNYACWETYLPTIFLCHYSASKVSVMLTSFGLFSSVTQKGNET